MASKPPAARAARSGLLCVAVAAALLETDAATSTRAVLEALPTTSAAAISSDVAARVPFQLFLQHDTAHVKALPRMGLRHRQQRLRHLSQQPRLQRPRRRWP